MKTLMITCLLFWAGITVHPTQVRAQSETIYVCAQIEGSENSTCKTDIKLFSITDGVVPDPETVPAKLDRSTAMYPLSLNRCDGSVTIGVANTYYIGSADCILGTDGYLTITMVSKSDIVRTVVYNAPNFDTEGFNSALAAVYADSSTINGPTAQRMDDLLMALNGADYAQAQKTAVLLAGELRSLGRTNESLAVSSIAYATGYQAMGLDPFTDKNPLLTTLVTPGGDTRDSFLVPSTVGGEVIRRYKDATHSSTPTNSNTYTIDWDWNFTRTVSEIPRQAPEQGATELQAIPPNFDFGKMQLDQTKRVIIPLPQFD